MNEPMTAEMESLKGKLRATWMAGNYDYFSRYMESSAVEFLDRLPVRAGIELLDVACGSGQLGLLAAKRGAKVTGVDIASNSIEAARGRAASENLNARFTEGDAEALPFADQSFDLVASIYGAMFAPRPELVARELMRVCRSGGTVAMANWNKEGFIGKMLQTVGKFISPPGMPSPLLWGDEETVRQRLGGAASELRLTKVIYRFDYPYSPAGVVDFFREHYGPTTRAFAALPEAEREGLRLALVDLWSTHNESKDPQRTIVPSEYLEVVATRA